MEYVLLSGFRIHSLNQPAVRSLQPVTPALHANEMAFTSLHLQGKVVKGQRKVGERPAGGHQALKAFHHQETTVQAGEKPHARKRSLKKASERSYRSVCLSGLLVQLAVTFLK